jgi:site-specific DNA-methyltransferase (adenine-specific)
VDAQRRYVMIPEWNSFINADCMEYLKEFPDNYFDLAVVDPPYGGGCTPDANDAFHGIVGRFGGRFAKYLQTEISAERRGCGHNKYDNKINHWDIAPQEEYFDQLFRVSKNQIIWGGNYFELPPTRCFIVWEKLTISEKFSMAMAEYAWTSFNDNAKIFKYAPQGRPGDNRFHPTQKPVALYEWVLSRYAQDNDTILDTHVGSASSLIACRRTNHKYIGFEIDPVYYKKAKDRLDVETAQVNIFDLLQG